MKSKNIQFAMLFVLMIFTSNIMFSQQKSVEKNNSNNKSVVMTWNKNTPDQEMLDDIKALKQNNNVTIKYSNLKRNPKGEIVAIKIEYKDSDGNTGSQEYNGKNAISQIKFFKTNDGIGFGEPTSNQLAFNDFDFNNFQKTFGNRIQMDTLMQDYFDFNPKIQKKSKIVIQANGKKPLTIEDGNVIEGGEDYSDEEIAKIKSQHQLELKGNGNQKLDFNFSSDNFDMKSLKEQIEKMQSQLMEMSPNDNKKENIKELKGLKSKDKETTKEELKQAKEEMIKAKKEMEEARAALEKAKSEIKMRKI